jgi:nucleoside-diphosphate-sugar epimerase
MKVFVAGGTGVIGRRAVARLVAAGHEVTALARSPERAQLVRSLGATPVTADLFEPEGLAASVAGHDAVVNLATHIPPVSRAARTSAWDENARIRTEGAANLVDAALAAGARRFVQESVAFLAEDRGDAWVDEEVPVDSGVLAEPVRAAEASARRFGDTGGTAVVLRFGLFFGADSDHTRTVLAMARRGLSAQVGRADGHHPTVDVDDAAAAVVAALDAPSGTYLVVDDEPLTRAEQDRVLAGALGRRRLRRVPDGLVRRSSSGRIFDRSVRASNHRFREETGWAPTSAGTTDTLERAAASVDPALPVATRVALWVLLLGAVTVGAQALVDPVGFHADFPFGRGWVAADGPYSEHLVRDFGAMNLALAVTAAAALWTASRTVVRVSAAAFVVFAVPHAIYHLGHVDGLGTADRITQSVTTWGQAALALLAVLALRWPVPTTSRYRDRSAAQPAPIV